MDLHVFFLPSFFLSFKITQSLITNMIVNFRYKQYALKVLKVIKEKYNII